MITEDYVSFETAKLLEQKGFNEKCQKVYDEESKCIPFNFTYSPKVGENYIKAPTLQMAMKWLREDKKRIINAWFDGYDYQSEVGKPEDEIFTLVGDEFKTYEEACEAAIKYCLENLI